MTEFIKVYKTFQSYQYVHIYVIWLVSRKYYLLQLCKQSSESICT